MLDNYGETFKNYNLINNNTYKVNCICDYFVIINDVQKLQELIKYLKNQRLKYRVIGNGSNIIFKSRFNGVIIKLDFNYIKITKNKVIASADIMLPFLNRKCIDNNLSGLEWASGIPGTIGGSIINNAGAYNEEIMNYVDNIKVLINDEIVTINKNDINYSYRDTSLKGQNIIILEAKFILNTGEKEDSLKIMQERTAKRIATQPLDFPSAGSVFRNPTGYYAGKMIEELGLKGKIVGGAKVSEKHANFIINYHQATGEDIIQLIDIIKKKIKENYNIDIISEQEIIN